MKIYDGRVNHLDNPLGYSLGEPVFSWKVKDAAGTRQTQARLRVRCAGRELADTGWADLDRLGTKLSLALEPCTRYSWTVAVRTDAGEEGESAPHWFETGKMAQPWQGGIGCPEGWAQNGRHPVFSKAARPVQELIIISTHALREEGDRTHHKWGSVVGISTHALREEGDARSGGQASASANFYPRPPRGGRPPRWRQLSRVPRFLPTPSARRATPVLCGAHGRQHDFYPRPPRGGRRLKHCCHPSFLHNFYPRPPRGGRQQKCPKNNSTFASKHQNLLVSERYPAGTEGKQSKTILNFPLFPVRTSQLISERYPFAR